MNCSTQRRKDAEKIQERFIEDMLCIPPRLRVSALKA